MPQTQIRGSTQIMDASIPNSKLTTPASSPYYNDNITNGTNISVPANKSLYLTDYLECSNGDSVEVASGAVLEVG